MALTEPPALGLALRLRRRRARARAGRAAAAVGAVEARALEDDADRGVDLAQLALAVRADGQRVVGELLNHFERLAALGALVLVRRHGHAPDWHSDTSSANCAISSARPVHFGKTCTIRNLHAYWIHERDDPERKTDVRGIPRGVETRADQAPPAPQAPPQRGVPADRSRPGPGHHGHPPGPRRRRRPSNTPPRTAPAPPPPCTWSCRNAPSPADRSPSARGSRRSIDELVAVAPTVAVTRVRRQPQ